jgi:hypothetical protein
MTLPSTGESVDAGVAPVSARSFVMIALSSAADAGLRRSLGRDQGGGTGTPTQ